MRLVQKNSKIKFFVFALALIILLVEYSPLLAAGQYTALSPIPMNPNPDLVGPPNSDISSYLKSLYNFGIGLAAGLAVLMVIWGGVEYMTTDAIGHQEEGKNKIQNAIMGLLLALSSYIILQTINKDLLKLDFNPDLNPVDAQSTANPAYVNDAYSPSDPTDSEGSSTGESVADLAQNGEVFPNQSWNDYALQQVKTSGLANLTPSDATKYFPDGKVTAEGYVNLLAGIANRESGFNPNNTYYEKTMGYNSVGLLQLSATDKAARNFGYSEQDLKDPYKNIQVGVQIMKDQIQSGGVISGQDSSGKWIGGSAYWSTLR